MLNDANSETSQNEYSNNYNSVLDNIKAKNVQNTNDSNTTYRNITGDPYNENKQENYSSPYAQYLNGDPFKK